MSTKKTRKRGFLDEMDRVAELTGLTLSVIDDRMLATLQTGAAAQAIAIETGCSTAMLAAEQAEEIKRLRRRVAALEAPAAADQGQLFDASPPRSQPAANGGQFQSAVSA